MTIESYFKESSYKRTRCDTSVCANVQFVRKNYQGPKVFRGWELLYQSLLVWFVLTVMFIDVNLGANVKPDLEPLFDFTKFPKVTILDSRYSKITLTCNYRNIFRESLRILQETEQLVSPRKCPVAVTN